MNTRVKNILIAVILMVLFFCLMPITGYADDGSIVIVKGTFGGRIPEAWANFMKEWGYVIAGVSGIATLTSFLVFLIQIMMLPTMSSHPIKKRQAMMGMMWSMITISIIGGLSTVLSLIYTVIYS